MHVRQRRKERELTSHPRLGSLFKQFESRPHIMLVGKSVIFTLLAATNKTT